MRWCVGELVQKGSWRVERIREYRDGLHVERMDEYRMAARRVLMADVSGGRVRGRQRLGLMDSVKMALGSRGITVETARQCAKDGKEWRTLVYIKPRTHDRKTASQT